ncbi:DUF4422 domain-containing protein [uncultured Methanobrevibacter sp.]|uniref:DUF4422 domain-containing protein n=1 Tax=uncultured Methanobrevibacter sp. TaxID=253161 RepID=UPI0025E633F4|nr:DUF4422 domain-containing protein [uncultured Methanobrevibacter sp.]
MSEKKIQLYVITHSPKDIVKIKKDEIYTPLFVGRDGKDNLGFTSDDSGDNISSKNPNYCELTGLYWMWKNSNADILGLCHYRRYFKNKGHTIRKQEIDAYLNEYDIILPKKTELIKGSLAETYKNNYILDALMDSKNAISKISPEYLDSFDKIMNGSKFFSYNMFIMDKELVDNYCNWIFPILKEMENKVDLSIEPRIFGLISEAILNVWVDYNKLKVKELDLKYIGISLKTRMFIANIEIFRNIYRFIYYKNPKLAKKIMEFFY